MSAESAALINGRFSNGLFSATSQSLPVAGNIITPYTKLTPKKRTIDILNDYRWKNAGSASEVPSIYATELELDYGIWYTNFAKIFNGIDVLAQGDLLDPYQQMYSASPTNFVYRFPWLINNGSPIRNVSNSWENAAGLGDLLKSSKEGESNTFLGKLIGAGIGAITPGVGTEKIKQYADTTPQSITISFPLYNTTSIKDAYDNFCFVQLFTFQNLKTRTSFMTYIPPKIYTLDAGTIGGYYSPVSYVEDFSIESIGTTRDYAEFAQFGAAQALVPEAYKVTIRFKEILPMSSNIFEGAIGGSKVQVTSPQSTADTTITVDKNNLGSVFKSGAGAVAQALKSKSSLNFGFPTTNAGPVNQ